ncbi:I78 family peptidase inhibitor [Rhizobium lusitanum]|uniref:Peptidase inhibitor I78 family protein n=1 Tax=Rhizobium lusitanum TaxID=293958 RepID=A0A7X0MEF0_9HYPH|nr:I78 family peptidase inhibitor [Rhizobium lusitanum]MBB6485933.1 hypothetical protein [Rhizobium lusitanum]
MVRSKLFAASALALALVMLMVSQGEAQQAKPKAAPGICRGDAAKALIGKKRVTDGAARRLTGASIVRQINPGQGVTMDYRQERVTIETNPKTRRIIRAYCG